MSGTPPREIPTGRLWAFYAGLALSGVGLLLFLSVFLTAALHFGDFDGFDARARSSGVRAIAGMALMMFGGGLTALGARGLAGSGLWLDPERAGRDLAPWARLRGRLLDQTYAAMPTVRGSADRAAGGPPAQVVKVRCRSCQALNDEHDKFCGQCGAAL